jgi:Na+-driven multidrug efflux pump
LASIYTNNSEVIELTRYLFLMQGVNLAVDGARNMYSGTLRAFDDTTTAMYMNIISAVFTGAGGWILGLKMNLGADGITAARTAGISAAVIGLSLRTRSFFHKIYQYGFSIFHSQDQHESEHDIQNLSDEASLEDRLPNNYQTISMN